MYMRLTYKPASEPLHNPEPNPECRSTNAEPKTLFTTPWARFSKPWTVLNLIKKALDLKSRCDEVYYTNASILLAKIILFSKLHCIKLLQCRSLFQRISKHLRASSNTSSAVLCLPSSTYDFPTCTSEYRTGKGIGFKISMQRSLLHECSYITSKDNAVW